MNFILFNGVPLPGLQRATKRATRFQPTNRSLRIRRGALRSTRRNGVPCPFPFYYPRDYSDVETGVDWTVECSRLMKFNCRRSNTVSSPPCLRYPHPKTSRITWAVLIAFGYARETARSPLDVIVTKRYASTSADDLRLFPVNYA